jgi:hypothetical protein
MSGKELLNFVFKDLVLVMVDITQNTQFVIYAAKLKSMYSNNTNEYIIVITPSVLHPKQKAFIFELNWVSVSYRVLQDADVNGRYHSLPPQVFSIPRGIPNPALIEIERKDKCSIYRCPDVEDIKDVTVLFRSPTDPKHTKTRLLQAIATKGCVVALRQYSNISGGSGDDWSMTAIPSE